MEDSSSTAATPGLANDDDGGFFAKGSRRAAKREGLGATGIASFFLLGTDPLDIVTGNFLLALAWVEGDFLVVDAGFSLLAEALLSEALLVFFVVVALGMETGSTLDGFLVVDAGFSLLAEGSLLVALLVFCVVVALGMETGSSLDGFLVFVASLASAFVLADTVVFWRDAALFLLLELEVFCFGYCNVYSTQ